jgi:hypothetical protein
MSCFIVWVDFHHSSKQPAVPLAASPVAGSACLCPQADDTTRNMVFKGYMHRISIPFRVAKAWQCSRLL